MSKPFYLTTPLYYVNARPHIGHAYTTVVADSLARWHRLLGEEVYLLTGTDEHGEKIAQAANAQGVTPQAFADSNSKTFLELWKKLGISYDRFIRTTDSDHVQTVQQVLEKLKVKGVLKLGSYRFWYCIPCETHYGLSEIPASKAICPNCQRPVQQIEEEDYFLPLEGYRKWLIQHIETTPEFIRPQTRRNEVLGMLKNPLPDLCITRPKQRVGWGIDVPFSSTHVTYVWFDALLNYVSALGWPDGEKFRRYWQEAGAIHLIGKDIIRHHALYWPIILRAIDVPPPQMIFAHGWWLVKGEKMSKSKGNIVDPNAVIDAFGLDALRYFLLRDVPFGEDGVFSEEALTKRYNSDLANDLGNLVFRTLTMIEKHTRGQVPPGKVSITLAQEITQAYADVDRGLKEINPPEALKVLWTLIGRANLLVEEKAPWNLAKEGKRPELESFLFDLAQVVRAIAILLFPFLPTTAQAIWEQLGCENPLETQCLPEVLQQALAPGQMIRKGKPLFPRIQSD